MYPFRNHISGTCSHHPEMIKNVWQSLAKIRKVFLTFFSLFLLLSLYLSRTHATSYSIVFDSPLLPAGFTFQQKRAENSLSKSYHKLLDEYFPSQKKHGHLHSNGE